VLRNRLYGGLPTAATAGVLETCAAAADAAAADVVRTLPQEERLRESSTAPRDTEGGGGRLPAGTASRSGRVTSRDVGVAWGSCGPPCVVALAPQLTALPERSRAIALRVMLEDRVACSTSWPEYRPLST
jgi:hypothetical protein